MDMEMEKKIAKAFICKNKRERFVFDLSRKSKDSFGELPRKRLDAICRLEAIIDDSYVVMPSRKFPIPTNLIEIMTTYGVGNMCYTLSEYKEFDGVYIGLEKAVNKLQWEGFPALIVGLPSGFSYYRGESSRSFQPNFFLKPSIRFDGIPW